MASLTNAAAHRAARNQASIALADTGAGVATVQLPGGATLRARGDAAVADVVFVRDGVIEGPAPALTLVTIDV